MNLKTLSQVIPFFCLILYGSDSFAQCPNNNSLHTNYNTNGLTLNTPATVTGAIWGGEYVNLTNMNAGETYRIESCGSTSMDTYLTIYSSAGGSSLAFDDNSCGDDAQIDFVPPSSGAYHVLMDASSSCNATIANNSIIVTSMGLLPVELVSFTAKALQQTVTLSWTTAAESNNQGFEVLRSGNGIDWDVLGFVNGQGSTDLESSYSFLDVPLLAGTYSYRLNQRDFNGSSAYSKTVEITIENNPFSLTLSPNPASTHVTATIQAGDAEQAKIIVWDLTGKEVLATSIRLNGAAFRKELDISTLVPGMYTLSLFTGQGKLEKLLLVQ